MTDSPMVKGVLAKIAGDFELWPESIPERQTRDVKIEISFFMAQNDSSLWAENMLKYFKSGQSYSIGSDRKYGIFQEKQEPKELVKLRHRFFVIQFRAINCYS